MKTAKNINKDIQIVATESDDGKKREEEKLETPKREETIQSHLHYDTEIKTLMVQNSERKQLQVNCDNNQDIE